MASWYSMNRFYRLGIAIAMMAVAACSTHTQVGSFGDGLQGEACMSSDECATQFCQWAEGHACGDGSTGTCAPRIHEIDCPDVIVDYVCGCDGKTYPNTCQALNSGESVAYHGVCH